MIFLKSALVLSLTLIAQPSMAENLCIEGEQIVFTCAVKKRVASVCASIPFTKSEGNMQYRFGTKSNVEFRFPPNPSPQGKHFYLSSTPFSGGGETHLRFINGVYEYIVYERTTRGEEDGQDSPPVLFNDGILIKKSGKKIAQYKCDKNANRGISAVVYDVLQREPFKSQHKALP